MSARAVGSIAVGLLASSFFVSLLALHDVRAQRDTLRGVAVECLQLAKALNESRQKIDGGTP